MEGFGEVYLLLWRGWGGLFENCQHIALAHDEVLLALILQFGACIFAVEDMVAGFQHHLFVFGAGAYCQHLSAEGFLFGAIRNDDSAYSLFFCSLCLYTSTRSANG